MKANLVLLDCAMIYIVSSHASSAPPLFTVDLSVSPENRWAGAVASVLAVHSFKDSFGEVA